jgi:methylmalonyl-CoA mutase C-terminal domain/subunit
VEGGLRQIYGPGVLLKTHSAWSIGLCKHEIPSTKFQINLNHQNSNQNLLGHLKLEFGAYLGFACLPVGREFVIWDLERPAIGLSKNPKGATMGSERKIRILIAKPGLDGHDRGAKVIARGFRDAGFEVIYTGLHQTPEQIVAAAIQEDVDAIGLSSLAGAHDYLFPKVIELLKEKGADDIIVFGGGIVPEEDMPALTQAGVKAIFTPGAPIEEAVKWVRKNIKSRK